MTDAKTDPVRPAFHGFEQIPLREYAERAYLDYSMYVVLDRALPFLGDGLKPVQRRIVYAMSELGLSAASKPKKSARTVGDVIGKFHPHGDGACYEALVLMAQPFSYRYPLIEGQGNFGSPDDPKSFAAMRYTESKLTPIAEVLLGELGQGTADWTPNFDGTLEEPTWLPARLPHLLLNGTTGIAVGMATDVPPHNLREVVSACLRLLDDPDASVRELCEHVRGPDYPTTAEIISPAADLLAMYETGVGAVRARATFVKESANIVVNALPYQVSPSKVIEQIAAQMRAKKLPWLEDLRDESDHANPVRVVLIPRSNRVDAEQLMGHLFATTDLERSYRVNLNIIGLDGRPQVKNLKMLLAEWLVFRADTVTRRLNHRLDKVERRLHLLEGLLTAFLNLDEVIRIIRSEDEPRPVLIARFALSEEQADYILDTRLRQLARLEEMKIRGEQDALDAERDRLIATLGSKAKLKKLIKDELQADAAKFGDARRSPLVARDAAQALDETELVASEPMTIVLSEKGWVRAAKGHDIDASTLSFRDGDGLLGAVKGRSTQQVAFLDANGRAYSALAHALPSARGNGEPLTGRFSPPGGAAFQALATGDNDARFVLASSHGYGFLTRFENLTGRQKAGKAMLTLTPGATVLAPAPAADPGRERIVAVTSAGHLLAFALSELPELDRGKGNKIIEIPKAKRGTERVVAIAVVAPGATLLVRSGTRSPMSLSFKQLDDYLGSRGSRGGLLPRGWQKVDALGVGVMDAEFWRERWREGRIGFHQARPSPLLEAHWDALALAPAARVLVPLCGKTLDMAWLAARGHRVLGVELSERAVREFFDEHGLVPTRRTSRYGEHYLAGPFELICGDAFALDRAALADCAGVFDRAALIALPPELRRRYRDRVYAALPAGCRGLLIAIDYPQQEMDGPPFALSDAEVRASFDADWTITRLERRDVLAQEPAFVAEGVTRLHTSAYLLSRAPAR